MSDAAGAATDSKGRAVLDPTQNVLDLVDAAIKRQDDLRKMDSKYLRREAKMRADHARDLRQAETDRINAIREVDVSAVQRAAEVQAAQASTLATQVATTADAFRASLSAALAPIQASIEDLRRSQYEAQGKGAGTERWIGYAVGVVGLLLAAYAATH